MPPKKDKKKAEPDESTNTLLPKYKRKCDSLCIHIKCRGYCAKQDVYF